MIARATDALSERGERFNIGCSAGVVLIPTEVSDAADALRICDQRMYANKGRGRRTVDEAVHHVLLRVAAEHDGDCATTSTTWPSWPKPSVRNSGSTRPT